MVSSVSHFQEAALSQLKERLAARQKYTDWVVEQLQANAVGRLPLPDAGDKAHQLLVWLMDQDDVEAYLHTFEVIATREGWVREEWARLITPFLTGEAQRAYYFFSKPPKLKV